MYNVNQNTEQFELSEGMEVDMLEGWRKITGRQFGGDAGRGFGELIQNLIDSYDSKIPMEERTGEITTHKNSITITDYGEGFTTEKIRLIITLGGSDKSDDNSKIGQFGIGFFSIFNPALYTQEVTVTTRCNDFTVQIVFIVKSHNEIPELKMTVLDEDFDFSTQIKVQFGNSISVEKCLSYAMKSLKYYPCKILIDGKVYESIWEKAKMSKWINFHNSYCNGFLIPNVFGNRIHILCKYEYILPISVNSLICGSSSPAFNLDDYKTNGFPFVPEHETYLNCNNLTLTISRDSFYLNYNYTNMVNSLKEEYFSYLLTFDFTKNKQLALANLYIFSYDVGRYLKSNEMPANYVQSKKLFIERLTEAKIFFITDKKEQFSLKELKGMITEGLPLFYSPNKANVEWLGGRFKHDFIMLPERCHLGNGANRFYETLLSQIFIDIVDLDTIQGNNKLLNKLVERDIVSTDDLSPKVEFVGKKKISTLEQAFLDEINQILQNKEIIKVIEENLYLSVASVSAIFFEISREGAYISTGIFDKNMAPVSDNFISNLDSKDPQADPFDTERVEVWLGLRKDHPLIQQLVQSDNKHKIFYALTYIAHELALCQRLLVPYSSFFHLTREKLASDMRKALINYMLENMG